jgi:UDPglucose 6-dehydrogenase
MRVCVFGLWHLGSVTAACVAEHFDTVGCDPDSALVSRLAKGEPPLCEPGLEELIQAGLRSGRLRFVSDPASAVSDSDVVWITFDTPVDENDVADVGFVESQIASLFPYLADGTLVLISSQVPVGFTAKMEAAFLSGYPGRNVRFACAPENLRLGKALDAFRHPERIVIGVREGTERQRLAELLSPFCQNLEWMAVESAEMTKHALNAYMAISVCFANEIAAICERVGADAKQVERGLKSDPRIGVGAYLSPGSAFAGGTLARDVTFLDKVADQQGVAHPLLAAIRPSNDNHKGWHQRKLREMMGAVSNKKVALLGLTYKPGTNTLRRSSSLELCLWLEQQGAVVQAYDPAISELPLELAARIHLCHTVDDALDQTDAAVIATPWPEFRQISADQVISRMRAPIVLDPARFLSDSVGEDIRVRYAGVGKGKLR